MDIHLRTCFVGVFNPPKLQNNSKFYTTRETNNSPVWIHSICAWGVHALHIVVLLDLNKWIWLSFAPKRFRGVRSAGVWHCKCYYSILLVCFVSFPRWIHHIVLIYFSAHSPGLWHCSTHHCPDLNPSSCASSYFRALLKCLADLILLHVVQNMTNASSPHRGPGGAEHLEREQRITLEMY